MSVKYDDYRVIANKISYWLLKNNKKIKLRKEYSLSGKKKTFAEVKKIILANQNTTNSWGRRFLQAAVADNKETSLFPEDVTYKGKKYTKAQYIYMTKYVTLWFNNSKNKTSPVTIPISAPIVIKKYGRSSQYGCNNRGQNNCYYCGPHMVQEIIRNLTGKVISQSTLAGVMGTTSSGTDHEGINTAFVWFNKKYDFKLDATWKNFSDVGWAGIKKILESKNQDCGIHELYRGTWGHYTNFDKVYDSTVDVHNSLGDYCTGSCYCGYTENRSKSTAKNYISGISQKSVLVVTRSK